MKKSLFLFLLLISFSFPDVNNDEDLFTVSFSGFKYEKEIPSTNSNKLSFIKELEIITNELAKSVESFSQTIVLMEKELVFVQDTIFKHLEKINELTKQVDSLTQIIKENEAKMQEEVTKQVEIVKKEIEKLDLRPFINYGISAGISVSNRNDEIMREIGIEPRLLIKKFDIGVPINIDQKYRTRFGIMLGMWFK